MHIRYSILAAVAFCMTLAPHMARAGAAPEDAASLLEQRGYSDIEIEPNDAPGYQAWACKGGTRFAIKMDPANNIVDVDPVGHCGPPPSGDLHVQAPFADVRIGEGRVRIRAPFVNLDIR